MSDTETIIKERDEARAQVEIITLSKNNPVAEFFSSPNTPETDALVLKKQPFGGTDYEWIELSRRLERERDNLQEIIRGEYPETIADALIRQAKEAAK